MCAWTPLLKSVQHGCRPTARFPPHASAREYGKVYERARQLHGAAVVPEKVLV